MTDEFAHINKAPDRHDKHWPASPLTMTPRVRCVQPVAGPGQGGRIWQMYAKTVILGLVPRIANRTTISI